MLKRLVRTLTIGVLALAPVPMLMLAPATALHAQLAGQGEITGRVIDPTGAIISNATVTVLDTATGVKTVRKTTGAGVYVVSPLSIGQYSVTVAAPGFATAVQEHIVVNATQSVGLDFKLTVGQQTEQITVTDAPPALETTNATLGATMENKTYSALPLIMNGGPRDPTAFVGLMAGVGGGGRSGEYNGQGGGSGYVDEVYIDGVPLTPISQQGDNRTVSLAVSVDAVDQFQVITSGASAQYQGMGVQAFNIKSGTNQYHGSAYVAFRNTAFDSWSFFAKANTVKKVVDGKVVTVPAPKPAEHQDEMNFTLGGPVRIPHLFDGRDKLFFFASYDRFHQSVGVNPSLYSIPTLLERQGNFTELGGGKTDIYDPTTLDSCTAANRGVPCTNQFVGMVNGVPTKNVIPVAEISPQAKYMQSFMPDPTVSGTQNNLLTGIPGGNDNFALNIKLDYQATKKQRFSIVSNSGDRGFTPFDIFNQMPAPYTWGLLVKEITATGILEHTYVMTDHLVNNFKYGYVRQWGPGSGTTYGNNTYAAAGKIGIGNVPDGQAAKSFPSVSFSGFADNPYEWRQQTGYSQTVNTYDVLDNLEWTRGKHNFTFGFIYQWLSENQSNFDTQTPILGLPFNSVNTAGYSGGKIQNTKTGNSYASFMLGAVNSTGLTVQPFSVLGARFHAFSPNIEDDWRVTPKLTLNLGLRWDMYTPYHEVQDRWSFLNLNKINPATGTLGAMEFAGNGTYSCHCSTPVNMYWGNLGPRLGLAYSLDSKTVIRAAYSIVYSHAGGVGGRQGANNGTGQTGLTGSAIFPSSGQAGAIPAYYLNNSAQFQSMGIANTSLPAFTATNNVTPFRDPTVNTGNYINAQGVAVNPQGVSYADPYLSGRAPYAESWNIGFERALLRDTVLSLNYSGSQSHFITGGDQGRGLIRNQLNPKYEVLGALLKDLPGNVDKATGKTYLAEAQAILPGIGLPYPNFGSSSGTIAAMVSPHPQYSKINDEWGNVANSSYNSLQLVLTQRTAHGVTGAVNYTYSKEIDDQACCRSGYDVPAGIYTDGIARKQDALDRQQGGQPQSLHIYGTWDLPFGKGHIGSDSKLVDVLASGWAFSSIFSYGSGGPIGVGATGCQIIGLSCFPSYTPGYGKKSPRINGNWGKGITPLTASTTPFLDASAFFVPNHTYQLGNVNRPSYKLFGIGSYDWDASIRRTFKIHDNLAFVFDADAVNVTNHVTFNISGTTINKVLDGTGPNGNSIGTNTGSNFGTIGGSRGARDWQFSGRLQF